MEYVEFVLYCKAIYMQHETVSAGSFGTCDVRDEFSLFFLPLGTLCSTPATCIIYCGNAVIRYTRRSAVAVTQSRLDRRTARGIVVLAAFLPADKRLASKFRNIDGSI